MPPTANSRNLFVDQLTDDQGRIYLGERTPFPFQDLPDNFRYTVVQGDKIWALTEKAYPGLPDAAMWYWLVLDFQPEPILDPTIALTPGRVLVFPSLRTIREKIMNPSRRNE